MKFETKAYTPNLFTERQNITAKPFVKWAGGKTQLLSELVKYVPVNYNKYIEPFVGGGALYFKLQPQFAILSDSNCELINLYKVVRDLPKQLIKELKTYRISEKEYYYQREINPEELRNIERAARFIYLNKTCYNGLYRVNKEGKFNVPYGRNDNVKLVDEDNINAASYILRNTELYCGNFVTIIEYYAKENDFIYLDPPYYTSGGYSDFKRYTKEFFYELDHIELRDLFNRLVEKGCKVLLTNSDTAFVHNLYKDYNQVSVPSKRLISCDSKTRKGNDLIIHADHRPKKAETVKDLLAEFPGTRYMGSKYRILPFLLEKLKEIKFETVLDAFAGSCSVSYLFKQMNKEVICNDYLMFSTVFAKALIENQKERITSKEIKFLLSPNKNRSDFISKTFKGLYFENDENVFLENVRHNIDLLENEFKRSIALSALVRACMKKRPRGIFTYVGKRYDDGRKDIQMTLKEHFLENIDSFNDAVFNNGKSNRALNLNVFDLDVNPDLVYLDPPYLTPHSDNDYTRRYHFVEGLVKNWEGLEIQKNTKTKKFKKYSSLFDSKETIETAFHSLFEKFKRSIIVLSYSSNSIPNKKQLISLLKEYKNEVQIEEIDLTYSFGNQAKNVNNNANRVKEYLFIAK